MCVSGGGCWMSSFNADITTNRRIYRFISKLFNYSDHLSQFMTQKNVSICHKKWRHWLHWSNCRLWSIKYGQKVIFLTIIKTNRGRDMFLSNVFHPYHWHAIKYYWHFATLIKQDNYRHFERKFILTVITFPLRSTMQKSITFSTCMYFSMLAVLM